MTEIESSIVAAWREAAADLGIQFTAPFETTLDGHRVHALGFVPLFGRRVGTVISAMHHAAPSIPDRVWDDYFHSHLSDGYTRYDRQLFIDTLNDWQFFGADSQKPSWYTGQPWC